MALVAAHLLVVELAVLPQLVVVLVVVLVARPSRPRLEDRKLELRHLVKLTTSSSLPIRMGDA